MNDDLDELDFSSYNGAEVTAAADAADIDEVNVTRNSNNTDLVRRDPLSSTTSGA